MSISASAFIAVLPGPAATVAIASGDAQLGTVNAPLLSPLAVRATDAFGNGVEGFSVNWSATAGGGTVAPATSTTGPDGIATTVASLGPALGANAFQASSSLAVLAFQATSIVPYPTRLVIVSGDNQTATAGTALPQPLVVRVLNPQGVPVPSVPIAWTSNHGSLSPTDSITAPDGTAKSTATLGQTSSENSFTATVSDPNVPDIPPARFHAAPKGLVYFSPQGGTLQLLADQTSTPQKAVLDLMVAAPQTAYSVGFDLPIDATKVRLSAQPLWFAGALSPGDFPPAVGAAIPSSGLLAGLLVTGISQKASGIGAVNHDTDLGYGAVLYAIFLEVLPGAKPGVVFDGDKLDDRFRGGMFDRAGTQLLRREDFGIGRLELR